MNSSCSLTDCWQPCLITFGITVLLLLIVHLFLYWRLVKLARQRFPNEGFAGKGEIRSCWQSSCD
jgi:hypothetical protein